MHFGTAEESIVMHAPVMENAEVLAGLSVRLTPAESERSQSLEAMSLEA